MDIFIHEITFARLELLLIHIKQIISSPVFNPKNNLAFTFEIKRTFIEENANV